LLFVKGNQPGLQRAIYDAIQQDCPREPDHVELDYGHGRIIKRSLWVADVGDLDFPHATRVMRIRRDGYDVTGAAISKEIVHAVTSLDAQQAAPGTWPSSPAGNGGLSRSTGCATPSSPKTPTPAMPETGPRSWQRSATWPSACSISPVSLRSPGLSGLLPATGPACSVTYRYETRITNDVAARADGLSERAISCRASSALAEKKRRPAGDLNSGPATGDSPEEASNVS
jgi:hypothetical protein